MTPLIQFNGPPQPQCMISDKIYEWNIRGHLFNRGQRDGEKRGLMGEKERGKKMERKRKRSMRRKVEFSTRSE